MQNFSLASLKNSLDEVRAQVYPRNETERKVYEALSSKNWGASSTLLNEIASDSNDYEKYGIMSNIIWANLDTDGKSWKQIFKTLTLIDFLIKNGSERFIEASRDKLHKIRTLQDFNFYEGTVDKGSGVREKAKSLVEMLGNNEIIRSERDKSRQLRNKFVGIDSRNAGGNGNYGGSYDNSGGGGGGSQWNNGNNSYSGNNSGSSNGGRYGGDSSYDNNVRYGDQGIDSQNSNRRGSETASHGNNNAPSRYGGGAYDSDHPPRYGDDVPVASTFEDEQNKTFRSTKPKTTSVSTTSGGGGKLKVSIKKIASPLVSKPVVVAPEVDLFGEGEEDFMSANTVFSQAAAQNNNTMFDAFSSPPPTSTTFDPFGNDTTVPSVPVNNYNDTVFDPFGVSLVSYSPQPVPTVTFDPFVAAPQSLPTNNNNFQPQYQQQHQPAPYQNNRLGSVTPMSQVQYTPHLPQTTPLTIAPNRGPSNTFQQHEADFGDFEVAPQQNQQQKAAPVSSNKWGDLGKLVDLSGIGKNEVQAKPTTGSASNNNYQQQQSAFAGLDGFSKTVHNMSAAPNRPLNCPSVGGMSVPLSGMAPRPGQQPMGMAPPVSMGGGGMGMVGGGQQPYYGAQQGGMMGAPANFGFQQQQYAPQMQQQHQFGQPQQLQPGMMMGGGNVQQGIGSNGFAPQQQYPPNGMGNGYGF